MQNHPKALVVASTIIALEALVLWAVGVWSVVALIQNDNTSFVSAIFLVGIVLGGALWATNVALGIWRKKRWAFSPSLILQLLIVSIGVASFGGEFGNISLGIGMLVPAATAFFVLFSKGVRNLFVEK